MPFDLQWVRERLPGRRIEWFDALDSTMHAAAPLARENCASGTIVGTEEQTAGIGRHGHSWHSEAGVGLYVSFILRVPLATGQLPLATLALGLAAHRAIADLTALSPDLRWPNDVLLDGKKCAGILAQTEGDAIIAGIGINVRQSHFPQEIAPLATSLHLAGARSLSREPLLVALAQSVDHFCDLLVKSGAPTIRSLFAGASSYVLGRRVRVDQDQDVLEGVTCGLDPSGFLFLRQDNGTITKILAGGVRPA